MESHGSVVTHLLSQVKIGMDLTKVVLPTFILERRSLLEMYADYFAHPDLFLRIVDMPTPKDRMVQVVRWYLSSYHAGRKSAVAKKPYNPIIGELFMCHWDIPELNKTNSDDAICSDGPVPWCKKNQLTFIAEQVSHHPPSKFLFIIKANTNFLIKLTINALSFNFQSLHFTQNIMKNVFALRLMYGLSQNFWDCQLVCITLDKALSRYVI